MKLRFFFLLIATSAALLAADPLEFQVGAFTFSRPDTWKWITPSSAMRKAQLEVPGTNQEKAEITFFHFGPGQGGGVQANVDRWFGQFQGGPTSQNEVTEGRTRVYYVRAAGTFQSGMPGGPTTPLENYALLGAILADENSGDVFVKMTGPQAVVQAASVLFSEMITQACETRGEAGLLPAGNP
jgi:hypothetical protein